MNSRVANLSVNASHIIFITGGTKSGKSEFAEHLAKKIKNLSYIALSQNNSDDKGWQEKLIFIEKKAKRLDIN